MAGVFTKLKRSEVISRIRSRGNKGTEVALARLLRAHKISGWRHYPGYFELGRAVLRRRPNFGQRGIPCRPNMGRQRSHLPMQVLLRLQ